VIDVPVLEARPRTFQSENWILDPGVYWKRVGTVRAVDLAPFVDNVGPLWLNAGSTRKGRNDEIHVDLANKLDSPLALVHVAGITIAVFSPGAAFGDPKRRVQAHFELGGDGYRLWVTDPVYERQFLAQADGEYRLGPCFLTISLGEPYKDHVYKLVAAIIEAT